MDSSLFPVMLPLFPSLILILLAGPAILTPSTSKELQVRGERTPRDADQDTIKVVISEGCSSQGDSSDVSQGGKEIDLAPGSPLVLTHKIKLVSSGSGSGSCGCNADFSSLRERLESLEREVSDLRGKCGETGGSCCTSESQGAGCSIKPEKEECPNECSDQGRCVDGKCVCFPGYSGPDCSESSCPGNCKGHGRCVNGQCVCDPGFSGPDCSQKACPDNCSNRGKCVNGKCVCNSGSTGPSCSEESCPKNCNRRGRCVNGQCVCNTGFTGPDCSKRGCPGNCNNRGRCVDGKCVCDSGSTGPDCSEVTCPGNCNNRGRCVDGKCVCDSGSTGPDCSEVTCPGNCNNRGRCVHGKCVCDSGSTGPDCSEVTCPGNCNNRGRCVDGKCVCDIGSTGPDCSEVTCPGNCNNRGRCVHGKCVCDIGSTGPDCSEVACPGNCNNRGRCVDGKCVCDIGSTGPDCSEVACPGNCNNRGRCVDGKCVCDDGFTGKDCQERACPNDCNDRGRCVDGKCVCDNGFTGTDCTETTCPGNCNNRGRCINGQCVCDNGFTGADCSEKTCPDNCSNRGTCVDGRCVCESGFSGDDCSEYACPENCKNRGRCINGQCVCNEGFTGEDCSEKGCPNNCNNHGRCVNGKCVCDVPFTGPDCFIRGCPNNCSNKGRCIKGHCVCRRGFTGPDCSQCKEGMTGPNCNIAMAGVSQLGVQDVTDSSATLIWTQPAVQYETYHITFTSQKEKDQQITAQVDGSLTTFTQTGLAASQEYIVTIVGEINGRRGVESTAEFLTAISGPTNLQVVKTTSTSAVVQWEESQADIDRYRLTITPKDGAGRSREMTIEAGQNSAHIQQLEAGRLYDVLLVAEKGVVRSQPATTQVVPGPEPPSNIMFSEVTEDSMTVSWTKPKSSVDGFKVTYTHADEGEPVSVTVGSRDSTLDLSQLSPGSSYEVTIVSTLGLDESDPIKDTVMTLPDPPTGLQAVNVTDSTALLLWRPALASVDKYTIVYGSGTGSEVRVTVSGNVAEQQLSGLEGSTTYTVTVRSQLGNLESSPATTSFTTKSGSAGSGQDQNEPQDLKAINVTPRSAVVSWIPLSKLVDKYILVYRIKGESPQEIIVGSDLTQFELTRLHPGSLYIVELRSIRGGQLVASSNTEFTTGTLKFPFPTDCSQELLNGVVSSNVVEIFPQGKLGKSMNVFCDMETDGGGWMVFQRRKDGSVEFYNGWKDYVSGFGNLSGEFWLGLEKIHNLTKMTKMNLRVDLRDGSEQVFAKYSTFEVSTRNYKLSVGGYSGTAGDSLSYHNNCVFSTKDRDPAPWITRCAISYQGGWWYKNCHQANLNGRYGIDYKHQGVIWKSWKGEHHSIQFTEMKMRPASFRPPASRTK
ncbi:tenascin-like isoform X3 [Xiphophorus hellerii]|uniref:tenascin-like isoform X3 n=1 Tax=Xiphophorus hellerii TaxID=8084 RepID=UPI0013B3E86A|nr:tenascin-like isoform X3 [Xiphophorus hellerii]